MACSRVNLVIHMISQNHRCHFSVLRPNEERTNGRIGPSVPTKRHPVSFVPCVKCAMTLLPSSEYVILTITFPN